MGAVVIPTPMYLRRKGRGGNNGRYHVINNLRFQYSYDSVTLNDGSAREVVEFGYTPSVGVKDYLYAGHIYLELRQTVNSRVGKFAELVFPRQTTTWWLQSADLTVDGKTETHPTIDPRFVHYRVMSELLAQGNAPVSPINNVGLYWSRAPVHKLSVWKLNADFRVNSNAGTAVITNYIQEVENSD